MKSSTCKWSSVKLSISAISGGMSVFSLSLAQSIWSLFYWATFEGRWWKSLSETYNARSDYENRENATGWELLWRGARKTARKLFHWNCCTSGRVFRAWRVCGSCSAGAGACSFPNFVQVAGNQRPETDQRNRSREKFSLKKIKKKTSESNFRHNFRWDVSWNEKIL